MVLNSAGVGIATVSLANKTLHHLVLVNNGGDIDVYVDGIKSDLAIGFSANLNSTSNIQLGNYDGTAFDFKGLMYDFCYWDTNLSPSQITSLASKLNPAEIQSANLQFYLKGNGNTNADWVDLSGNSNDGTVNGSPANIYIPAKADKLSDAVNNTILNPAGLWHNDAETKLIYPNTPELQVANDAQGSNWIFDASDVANHISYADIVANVNNNDYILADVSENNKKTGPLIFNPVLPTNELQTLKKHLNH